jgi:hypothetical protein
MLDQLRLDRGHRRRMLLLGLYESRLGLLLIRGKLVASRRHLGGVLHLGPLAHVSFIDQLRFERLSAAHFLCQCRLEFCSTFGSLLVRKLPISRSLLVRTFHCGGGVGQLSFELGGRRGRIRQSLVSLLLRDFELLARRFSFGIVLRLDALTFGFLFGELRQSGLGLRHLLGE